VSRSHRRSYCIVGGGISGLTAAYRLRCAAGGDAAITVFDPADRLGGILRTVAVGGQPLDVGAEAFVVRRPEVPALLDELGLADRILTTTGVRPLIFSQGRLHPLPADTVNGVPSSPASVAGLVDRRTQSRMAAEPCRPMSWRAGADPVVADVVGDRFGPQVVARSVDPMLAGVYAGSAASIGIRSAVPGVAAELDRGAPCLTDAVRGALPPNPGGPVFGAVSGGYEVLLRALIGRSGLCWQSAIVAALSPDGSGWTLHDEQGGQWYADAVVLALPAPRLATVIAPVAPRTAAAAARIATASSAVVALALPGHNVLPQHSGVLIASGEALHAKAITLSSRKWGARGDTELVRLSFGRLGDAVASDTPEHTLLEWSISDLSDVFGIEVSPVDVSLHRWVDAMPQYGSGHAELVAELRAGLPPGLAVAGNYLDGIGVPACVAAAGRAVAGLVAGTVAR
jgi:protoporphyrinogen/coproporphyrinogen III oxidase